MENRFKMGAFFSALLGVLCTVVSGDAPSRSVLLDRQHRESLSDLIIEARTVTAKPLYSDGHICGVQYEAKIEKLVKGSYDSKTILFGRTPGVRTGVRYRFYLKRFASPEELLELFPMQRSSTPLSEEDRRAVQCNELLPGYMFIDKQQLRRRSIGKK